MSVAIVDWYVSPPAVAYQNEVIRLTDEWRGDICGDRVCRGQQFTRSLKVRRPTACLDRVPAEDTASLVQPFFERLAEHVSNAKSAGCLTILLPPGVALEQGTAIRQAARSAGWTNRLLLAEAPAMYGAACEADGDVVITAYRGDFIERTTLQRQSTKDEVSITVSGQARESMPSNTIEQFGVSMNANGKDCGTYNACLISLANLLDRVLTSTLRLRVRRNGLLGLRSQEWELTPLADETLPITARAQHVFSFRNEVIRCLELWYGHPRAGGRSTALRHWDTVYWPGDHHVQSTGDCVCELNRRRDGSLDVEVYWGGEMFQRHYTFPLFVEG